MSSLTPLEEAELLKQEILDEIEDLKEELVEIQQLISELSAEESGNPYWTEPDDLGARLLKPMIEIRDSFKMSNNRAEYLFYHKYKDWHYDGLFASLTEQIDPQFLKWYSEAQTRYFVQLIVGRGLTMAWVADPATGERIEGYAIPWWGNYGPHGTTIRLQEEWANPNKLNRLRGAAERACRTLDRQYIRARLLGNRASWLEAHPWYIPEEEWHGNPEA